MAMFGNNKDMKRDAVATQMSNASTTINKGAVIDGNIETQGPIRVDGKVLGNINSKSRVVMGESSYMEGSILSQSAEVAGHLKGLLEVAELLVLKSTAVIVGDIVCNKLIVESGATFDGNCKMGNQVSNKGLGNNSSETANETKLRAQKTA